MQDRLIAGRYRLVSRLGSGAMGQVWRAVDERLRRDVAIKLVDLATATDAATAERFQREAVAAASLNHRTIVTVFDTGREGSLAFLVMELLPGRSLAEMIRAQGPLSLAAASSIVGEVAVALESTHAVGIVHRDIKPANIMVDGSSVKLLDFGIAQMADDAAHLTATATTIGTAAYMSPEQAQGLRAGPASDIYALGCVFMAALTGEPPFPGDNPIQVASRQITDDPPRVSSRRPEVPASVDALVARMLAKDPGSRPTATEVRTVLGTAPTVPTAVPPGPAATAVLPAVAPPPPPSAPETRVMPTASGRREDVVYTPPPNDSGFKKAARWIVLLIVALLVFGIVWALGSNLVQSLLPSASTPRTPSVTQPRTPSPAPTRTSRKPVTPAPITLPSMPTLPTVPSALQVAVKAVDTALDTISEDTKDSAKAKRQLKNAWAVASKQILDGKNPDKALEQFADKLSDHEEDLGPIEYLTILAALKAVNAAV